MWISKYFVYFILYSCMGWVYETTFCTIKSGQWENRGFLYGPMCPIYGLGAMGIMIIDDILGFYRVPFVWWQVFLVGFWGSIVLEYGTSWILEKMFHAYWWDYSDMPLNIHGRVCFPYSIGFGVAGLVVVYGIAPFTRDMMSWAGPMAYEIMGLVFMALMMVDTTLTISALSNFDRNVIAVEEVVNNHMESFVITMQERGKQAAGSFRWRNNNEAKEQVITVTDIVADTDLEEEAFEDVLMEERKSFARAYMEKMAGAMGALPRAAIRRVKGYKRPEKERKSYEVAFDFIKKYVPKKKGGSK